MAKVYVARVIAAVMTLHGALTWRCGDAQAKASDGKKSKSAPPSLSGDAPYCAPEVSELSHHICYFDGGVPQDGRRTLVLYLHGSLAMKHGFFYMQQRAMALHAKRHGFTVLMPTSPSDGVGYVWPTSLAAQRDQESDILDGIKTARGELERRVGHAFDETFVVGFSSGAYYGSALAVRGVLDVDGYIVLAGGSSWARGEVAAAKRSPVFVGVSAANPQTANHSRAFAGSLAAMHWPFKVEERNAGHMVDWTFMAHGIAWLRAQRGTAAPVSTSTP